MSGIAGTVGKKLLQVVVSLVVLAVLAGGYFAYKYFTGDADLAKAGDCMVGETADDIKTIDCKDSKAKWKVLGRVNGSASSATVEQSCKAYPETEVAFYSEGGRRSQGYVLCLGQLKR